MLESCFASIVFSKDTNIIVFWYLKACYNENETLWCYFQNQTKMKEVSHLVEIQGRS